MADILFLDDRQSRWEIFRVANPNALWVRDAAQFALAILAQREWAEIHLDHDLNDERGGCAPDHHYNNGVQAMNDLIRLGVKAKVIVHTTNQVAADYMLQRLRGAKYSCVAQPFDEAQSRLIVSIPPGLSMSAGANLNHAPWAFEKVARQDRHLIVFRHGLGDSVQLTVLLRHLRHYRPEWVVDALLLRGKHSSCHGHVANYWYEGQEGFDRKDYGEVVDLHWYENYNGYEDRPNSKITNCLKEVFDLDWDAKLGRYQLLPEEQHRGIARRYLESIGCKRVTVKGRECYNAALLHYQGNTSPSKKNLGHHQVRFFPALCAEMGFVPVVLDWDRRSPLPDQKTCFNPGVGPDDIWGNTGTGDSLILAALIEQSAMFFGIDSGPGKVASATTTPTIIAWVRHHPMQFHDPAANTLHLLPSDQRLMPPCQNPKVLAWFGENYRHYYHDPANAAGAYYECVREALL